MKLLQARSYIPGLALIFLGYMTDFRACTVPQAMHQYAQPKHNAPTMDSGRRFAVTGNTKLTSIETEKSNRSVRATSKPSQENNFVLVFSPIFSLCLTALYIVVVLVVICCCRLAVSFHNCFHWCCNLGNLQPTAQEPEENEV